MPSRGKVENWEENTRKVFCLFFFPCKSINMILCYNGDNNTLSCMVVTGVQGIRSKAHSRHSVRWTYCNILSCILFFFGWASLVSQMVETLPANAGDPSLISGLGRFPGEKNGNPPTPVSLPGGFHGQRSLVGYMPWSLKEPDTTEWLTLSLLLVSQKWCSYYH